MMGTGRVCFCAPPRRPVVALALCRSLFAVLDHDTGKFWPTLVLIDDASVAAARSASATSDGAMSELSHPPLLEPNFFLEPYLQCVRRRLLRLQRGASRVGRTACDVARSGLALVLDHELVCVAWRVGHDDARARSGAAFGLDTTRCALTLHKTAAHRFLLEKTK